MSGYCHARSKRGNAKYKRHYVDDNTRRRDKTWLLSLGYSIEVGELTPELDKIRFGLDVTHARIKSNQASAEIHSKTSVFGEHDIC